VRTQTKEERINIRIRRGGLILILILILILPPGMAANYLQRVQTFWFVRTKTKEGNQALLRQRL
jgi:hypothetical protein